MKRFTLAASFGLVFLGCGAPGQVASDPQADLIRTLFTEVWNTGDLSVLSPDAAGDSLAFHYRGQTTYQSFDDLGSLIAHWRSAFPDLRMDLEELVAAGDVVAVRVRYSGTHEGEWFGIPPTGRYVDVEEMMFFRFDDGQLVEAWEVDDQLTMRTQLGLIN